MKWLWAAYRRGVFAHLPEFPGGFDPFAFRKAMMAVFADLLARGGDAWIFIATTPKGEIPVGLVIAFPNRGHAEPHQFFFPEASPRNKLECSLKWLVEMKKRWKIDIWVRASQSGMFDHLCRYGVIRTVGKYRGCFEDGEDAFIYQSVHERRLEAERGQPLG